MNQLNKNENEEKRKKEEFCSWPTPTDVLDKTWQNQTLHCNEEHLIAI